MQSENRKKRVPGIHAHLAAIKELNQESGRVDTSITELREKISAAYKNDSENEIKRELYEKIETLSNEIKELRAQRQSVFDQKTKALDVYQKFKAEMQPEKGKIKILSANEIDARMKEINMKLISSKHDSKTEKTFESEIQELRRQKKNIGMMEQKSRTLVEIRGNLDALDAEIKDMTKRLTQKQVTIDELKAKRKEIYDSQSSSKNPIIEGYEKNIKALKVKKNEINEKKKAQQEEIRKKEIEHDKFLEQLALAQAAEKQRDDVKQRIQKLEEKKNVLSNEECTLDPSKFDSVIFRMRAIDVSGGNLSLPIDLALYLSQFKIPIPSNAKQLESTISALKIQKESFAGQVVGKREEIAVKIAELDRKISEEKNILQSMPPSDVRLLKPKREY
ncbi:hypothetical protein OCOL_001264 [Ordospora colligata]|uniref:Uncharacterized protein n=1 Tax=Ordospora colligata OC4 TaxID=1354746 RepID=A0A0B2UIR3_9MICR|nr:uncharacterized protein M896_121600 [Ordospora colligata OC4]KHN68937.1 hypothetical protein M896_121600 [Ordospora colligata OC4]TBU14160.1 hypothetical protein CWI41_121600 [Ordospora colligata]